MRTLMWNKDMGMVCTCGACPTQWEYTWPDGKYLYFRYRHSRLSIGIGHTEAHYWTVSWHNQDQLLAWHESWTNKHDDGWMEDDEAMARIIHFLDDNRRRLV